uniref:Uncharacterized protein n=1 Tax=Parascaris univalens TaxID=6257 RepID=A0A915AWJ6_PARUN
MRFTRSPSTLSSSMCSIELRITNSLETPSPSLQLIPKDVEGIRTSGALHLGVVDAKGELRERVSIDFGDSRRTSEWILDADNGDFKTVTIDAPVGEQIEPISMDEQQFDETIAHLSGMNEHSAQVGTVIIPQRLYAIANCTAVNSSSSKFCAQTVSKKKLVLIVIDKSRLHVHCEDLVFGSLLCDLIVKSFTET